MKYKTFTLFTVLFLFLFNPSLKADFFKEDELLWKSAYDGDFLSVHRLVLSRECIDINDDMISQFAMAYLYHRLGRYDEVEVFFKGVDAYIEYIFMLDQDQDRD